ncbi:copper fist DNA binding domain-containing protein [Chlamydoabsidia padenii]|nr:copper fist DNA binding domain-containing protein [Chlamydoabsidia padenii]
MIVIDNVKYACTACIKGHRSSQCSHTDRPLSAIRRKGRPISQCERCREQRKKYRIHQRCSCLKRFPTSKGITKFSIMAIDSLIV